MNAQREAQRVPKTPAITPGERAGAGCLGLMVLPWFISSLFSVFIGSVTLPLEGFAGVITGSLSLLLFLPLAIVLGSVSMSALSRAMGSSEPIQLAHRASAGIAVSAVVMFLLASLATLFSATSIVPIFGAAGVLALLGAITSFAVRSERQAKPKTVRTKAARERRKHDRPPRPPWTHPLARTEKTNLYAEALVDEYNIVAILGATGLSILLANPLPLITVGGLELIYLALVPDTKWFRRRVERKHLGLAHEQAEARRSEQIEYLATDQLRRHEEMFRHVERVREAVEASGFALDLQKFERAIDHHLWLMQLENYYSDLDTAGREREVDKQLAMARADLEGMSGRMAEVLAKRVDVLERRREQVEEFEIRLHEVTDKRRMLEETLLLAAESALAGPNSFDEIDDVLLDLQVTEEVVLDLLDEDDKLEAESEAAYAAVPQEQAA